MNSLQRKLLFFPFSASDVATFITGKDALRNAFILLAAFCAALTATQPLAADYPNRPVRLIVPAAPGGGPDVQARLIANEISKQMGQQVVVDNRPGAGGILGYQVLANATPDGYTIGYMNFAFIVNPSLYSKLPYNGTKDFQPIIFQSSATFLLTVTPSLPINSVKDLIEHARANPGALSYGSGGVGSGQFLTMELLKFQTGTNILHVPYKGPQQAIIDQISGQIHIVCDNIASIMPHVRAGRLRGLGVTTAKRSPVVPELPTIAEAGVPGYEAEFTPGYLAPARVPHDILVRLNAEINKALHSSTVSEKFAANGATIVGGTSKQFSEHIRVQTAKWGKVIKAAGIQPR